MSNPNPYTTIPMQTSRFSATRIGHLLRYDFAMERRNLLNWLLALVAGHLMIIGPILYSNWDDLASFSPDYFVTDATVCGLLFGLIMFMRTTSLLHKKFTNPPSATSYLALPGSSAEKFTVLLIDYLFVGLVTLAVTVVSFYLLTALAACKAPAVDWSLNPFGHWTYLIQQIENPDNFRVGLHSSPEHLTMGLAIHNKYYNLLQWTCRFIPIEILFVTGYYLVLNMLFRTYGQLKSILLLFLTQFALNLLTILAGWLIFGTDNPTESEVLRQLYHIGTLLQVLLGCLPLFTLAMYYLLYRQICRRQAK